MCKIYDIFKLALCLIIFSSYSAFSTKELDIIGEDAAIELLYGKHVSPSTRDEIVDVIHKNKMSYYNDQLGSLEDATASIINQIRTRIPDLQQEFIEFDEDKHSQETRFNVLKFLLSYSYLVI